MGAQVFTDGVTREALAADDLAKGHVLSQGAQRLMKLTVATSITPGLLLLNKSAG